MVGGAMKTQWPTRRDMVEVLCVNPVSGMPCSEDEMGEIWVRGPKSNSGLRQQRLEAARDELGVYLNDGTGPFQRTGDRGAWSGGRLFITERLDEFEANWFAEPNEPVVEAAPWEVRLVAWMLMASLSLLLWGGLIYLCVNLFKWVG